MKPPTVFQEDACSAYDRQSVTTIRGAASRRDMLWLYTTDLTIFLASRWLFFEVHSFFLFTVKFCAVRSLINSINSQPLK